MMPTPNTAESIAILRRKFGGLGQSQPVQMQDLPADQGYYGDPTGSIELSGLREGRLDEMRRNREFQQQDIIDSLRTHGPRTFSTGATGNDVQNLQEDIAGDPYTGTAEQQRIGGIRNALDTVNTFMRPETMGARRTAADEAAYGGGALEGARVGAGEAAKMRVGAAPDAQYIANEQLRRQQELKQTPQPLPGQMPTGEHGGWGPPLAKLSSLEKDSLGKLSTAMELGPQLLQKMESRYPGIAQNPEKYGSWLDTIEHQLGRWAYTKGHGTDPHGEDINQTTGLIEVALARAYQSGRLNKDMYNDIKLHLPQIGFSPGANYERLRSVLTSIIPAQIHGMGAANMPFNPANPGANLPNAEDVISDPNWGR